MDLLRELLPKYEQYIRGVEEVMTYAAQRDVRLFLDTMLAAANRDDEEAVRLAIVEVFENDHDVRPLVIPCSISLSYELWSAYTIEPGSQARIYL